MNVICLEDEAFYSLVDKVIDRLKEKLAIKEEKWILPDEAMKKLGINSKTTLQKYRDEGRIRFTQPDKKIILYDNDSIKEYLEKNAKNTF
jgi:hypothetical protein